MYNINDAQFSTLSRWKNDLTSQNWQNCSSSMPISWKFHIHKNVESRKWNRMWHSCQNAMTAQTRMLLFWAAWEVFDINLTFKNPSLTNDYTDHSRMLKVVYHRCQRNYFEIKIEGLKLIGVKFFLAVWRALNQRTYSY